MLTVLTISVAISCISLIFDELAFVKERSEQLVSFPGGGNVTRPWHGYVASGPMLIYGA